jgi:hypothetical protein
MKIDAFPVPKAVLNVILFKGLEQEKPNFHQNFFLFQNLFLKATQKKEVLLWRDTFGTGKIYDENWGFSCSKSISPKKHLLFQSCFQKQILE